MSIKASVPFMFAVALIVLGGCSNRMSTDDKLVFDIQGPVAVDVESFNGDVRVFVDEDREDATVQVRREADFGRLRGPEARKSLRYIDYTAEVVNSPQGPVLQVRTWSTHPEAHGHRAHVTIKLPAVNGLRVSTDWGRVIAVDTEGSADVSTNRGVIRYMTTRPVTQPVTLHSHRGDVDFRVRGESAGHIRATANDGEVDQRIKFGSVRIPFDRGNRKEIVLNEGATPIMLTSDEGDVRISVIENPTSVGWLIINP